ncbi:radical SAM protein [Acidaminobacter sp. JC074]|uniref:radical SAM protein n=1 Tax=Acidaminobacter sp. JC074 TaxID=2530199 RepID=UPI0021045444|nr:radical SAM protein [Acidaminobacter sp. JC074]
MSIERYSVIDKKNPREIVLLKSSKCKWGRCTFCDYIHDNSDDIDHIIELNKEILKQVSGELNQLEIINSGSCFELPTETLKDIRDIVEEKSIETVYFESHYMYRNRLDEIRDFFNAKIIFKCGVESFDNNFRKFLNKGFQAAPEEIASYFSSICLMVGIKGQTKEMIKKDIALLEEHFERGCVNVYVDNTTDVKSDPDLIRWFEENYAYLEENPQIEVLWHNTDFGVGGENE